MPKHILIIEDDAFQRDIVRNLLQRKLSYPTQEVACGQAAIDHVNKVGAEKILLCVLDLMLPDIHGLEVLKQLKQQHPQLPIVVLTGSDNVQDAVDAIQLGAADFMKKPVEIDRLTVSIQNALKMTALSKEVKRLRRHDDTKTLFTDLIGHDSGLRDVVTIGRKAANSQIPVLVMGETGTGKELLARAIHGESNRAGRPFIAINCGAIPENLVESTLFGHEKGSFTGAIQKSIGKFREAQGGTIFLDEVGELPPQTQVKLLRVLQQKEVEPVGAGKSVPIDVRVISATNRSLIDEVDAGRFREDLYFRLEGLPIHLPALRDRSQDIPELADHIFEYFASSESLPLKQLDDPATQLLTTHPWPGNIRELKNLLHRSIILCEGNIIHASDLTPIMRGETSRSSKSALDKNAISVISPTGKFTSLDQIEQHAMTIAMNHHNGNIAAAAASLGIAKSTFYRKWSEPAETA